MSRAHIHTPSTLSDRAADAVVNGLGSWKFVAGQSLFIVVWCGLNLTGFVYHWDPYPWILLNLAFSTQAAFASPLILLAGRRSATKDAARDDTEAAEVESLFAMQQRQLDILEHQTQLALDQHRQILELLRPD